ncbi:MAG: class I SAM-dependent methyltransferase [Pseudomonadales bacterium]|mgnify:CR=1 FL=1|jgi:SAM-dependent methyltransferase|nr:class I SAM-dependent methyltransferase [Pseudomonadales bacterium]HNG03450.1 class I SAM-dependent methyltransferase [Nitrospira sp.]HNG78345.1 class I SAM-dependent methyltransferase [Burkholderiaceae bacterium]MCP5332207.1 class I SAM-dependent methyltransferase [Pseudomonadales bacterium]HMW14270.1 class I SAM-dependent methyltransferase [Pseudomonadales bacterium]
MTSIYESGVYLENNPQWHEQDAPWKVTQIKKMLARNGLSPMRVCDVGCGSGEILRLLAEESTASATFVGYDISPFAHEIAKRKARDNLGFRLEPLPGASEQPYDLLLCVDVFEHVEDCFAFLREIKSKAVYKLFHIPLDLSVQTVLRATPLLQRRASIGHIHYFTKDTALATLRDAGYEITDHFYTHKFCDTPQSGLVDNVTKWVLSSLFVLNEELAVRILGCSSLMVLAK